MLKSESYLLKKKLNNPCSIYVIFEKCLFIVQHFLLECVVKMTKCAFFQTIILFLLERWMGEVNITYAQALAQLTREPALQRGEVHLQYKMKQPTQAFELLLRLLHIICYHCQLP